MAETIIRAFNAFPRDNGISPGYLEVGGATASGYGPWLAERDIAADQVLEMWFRMPPTLPAETNRRFVYTAVALATSGTHVVNVKWKSFAIEESISNPTLNAETGSTLTWAGGDSGVIKELEITMDADTWVGDEFIMVHLTLDTASTLAIEAGLMATSFLSR